MDRINNKLSADPSALVLGIVSLVVILAGCCCGLFTAVSLTLSIVGLVMANKSLREYALDPENFNFSSYKNVNTARILNIVGIVLSVLVLVTQIVIVVINGDKFANVFEELRRTGHYEYNSEKDSDTTDSWNDTTIQLKKQGDSIVIDTIATETQQ